MAPINADVAEVAAHLSALRLRRNGLAAQRAAAFALSATCTAAALVVAVALRGSATLFSVVTASASLVSLAAIAYAIWYARRQWLSLPATARLADAHAHLDQRLTTLVAIAPLTPAPDLRALLVRQVIDARERWDVSALAPQRLSRWLALVPLSMLLFAATAFYARPPATMAMRRLPVAPRELEARSLTDPAGRKQSAHPEALAYSGSQLAMVSGARGAMERGGARNAGGASDAASLAHGAGGAPTAGAADGGTEMGDVAAADQLADLRQSIRDAFGAPPERDLAMSAGGGQKHDHDTGSNGERGTDPGGARPGDQARDGSAGAEKDRPGSAGAPGAQSSKPGSDANGSEGAQGSGRGGAGGTGAQGVLGSAPAPQLAGAGAPMPIKLAAISGISPSQREPQRRGVESGSGRAAPASRNAKLPDLANEQLADVTMRQLEIGPEHEAIVRRLFTRE
jgi:hypothetical protein